MKNILLATVLVFFCSLQISCSGNECSATADFVDDIDSDCVDDSSDNCVGTYNPDQFDGDEDSVGAACDADDTDDTNVAIGLTYVPLLDGDPVDDDQTDNDLTYE